MAKKYNITKNFFTLQGWMITELGLKGNELMAYALVYGFSQDGNSHYTGSINYLAEWLNCSRNTVIETMKSLCEKKLLIKEQVEINNIIFNKYKAITMGSAKNELPVQKNDEIGSAEIALPVQKTDGGSAISAPNNIFNNIVYINKEEKEKKITTTEKIKKLEEVLNSVSYMPDISFVELELPTNTRDLALQMFVRSTGFLDASLADIDDFWEIFKKQNFNGEKYYARITAIYIHFTNWIKNQKLTKNKAIKEIDKKVKIILK